jgi:hypothetical protein
MFITSKVILLLLFALLSTLFGDSLSIENRKLPRIIYGIKTEVTSGSVFVPLPIFVPVGDVIVYPLMRTRTSHAKEWKYFTVENGVVNAKLNFWGSNLAEYLKPVPEAYSLMRKYKYCKLASLVIGFGGLSLSGITLFHNPINKPLLASGVIIACTCVIPLRISINYPYKSVRIYNNKINPKNF